MFCINDKEGTRGPTQISEPGQWAPSYLATLLTPTLIHLIIHFLQVLHLNDNHLNSYSVPS